MTGTTVGFIGAGNMATALASAISASMPDARITAYDVDASRLERFADGLPRFSAGQSNGDVVRASHVCFLAVKPQIMPGVMAEISDAESLVISIAAGIRIAAIEAALPRARVVRVMPNTPCLVGAMAAGYAHGTLVTDADKQTVANLLASAGLAVELPESLLDAVTGLSGSGPAFVARLVEAFARAGEAEGLPADVAYDLSIATFAGTVRLLQERSMTPDELVGMVSSPNGTTVAGRAVLESSDMAVVLAATVAAAVARSKELGE